MQTNQLATWTEELRRRLPWRRTRGDIDASALLRERAARVGSVFPAAFIVMGHTHLPELSATCAESAYVNLGAWAEEELDAGESTSLPATRTHLVVQIIDGRPTAVLMQWDLSLIHI